MSTGTTTATATDNTIATADNTIGCCNLLDICTDDVSGHISLTTDADDYRRAELLHTLFPNLHHREHDWSQQLAERCAAAALAAQQAAATAIFAAGAATRAAEESGRVISLTVPRPAKKRARSSIERSEQTRAIKIKCARSEIARSCSTTPFLGKLWSMLEDGVLQWCTSGASFEVDLSKAGAARLSQALSLYFRHNRCTSFQRQLNYFGFRSRIEDNNVRVYAHPHFRRNRPDELVRIRRATNRGGAKGHHYAVSYTHLTLPTKA